MTTKIVVLQIVPYTAELAEKLNERLQALYDEGYSITSHHDLSEQHVTILVLAKVNDVKGIEYPPSPKQDAS